MFKEYYQDGTFEGIDYFKFFIFSTTFTQRMYNNNTDKDLISAGLTAGVGAGIVTSFAVSQGQNPLIALAITVMSALFAVICYQKDLI